MNKELNILTDQTIIEISKLEIVLPEIYKDIFYTKADELGIKINESDKEKALIYALKKIEKLKNETHKNTTQLKTNIQQARLAISDKDDALLLNIEKEVIKLEKTLSNLEENLYIDELTNIYNRRWLYEKFLKDEKFQQNGTFAFLDLDNFKSVNDNYGHLVGDKVLKTIGSLLKKVDKSLALRFAGDEFILISTSKNKNQLSSLLKNARKNLLNTKLKHKNQIFTISFSFGILDFKKGDDFKKIFKKSDDLMYYYKDR
jgi:diguanylate cyclase (GGDEF)-like protein